MLKISKYIFVASSWWLAGAFALSAQTTPGGKPAPRQDAPVRGVQYVSAKHGNDTIPLFAGFSLGVDIVAPIRAAVSSQGGYEAVLRANLRQQWFPLVEVGYGTCDHTDESSNLHFKTSAPYFRIGVDYNFNKDRRSGNRVLGGLRLAGSSFKYDLDGPSMNDPYWGGATPYVFKSQSSAAIWAELVFGLEAKIWKNFHIGWSVRYKRRFYSKSAEAGKPWHVPGYGKNDSHTFGATFHLLFDI